MKHWFIMMLMTLILVACSQGGAQREGGFVGIGEGHVTASQGILRGEVHYNGYREGTLVLEARASFPCTFGRCPVIERVPLGQERLNGPGPFAISLTENEKNIILIATYQDKTGKTLVAHTLIPDPQMAMDPINLSLNRPHPPLR